MMIYVLLVVLIVLAFLILIRQNSNTSKRQYSLLEQQIKQIFEEQQRMEQRLQQSVRYS